MKLTPMLKAISQADAALLNQTGDRRSLLRQWAPRLAAATLPFLSLSLAQKATAAPSEEAGDLLRLVLGLNRLESSFFELALKQAGLFPASLPQDRACIELIAANKKAHLSFIELMMQSAGVDSSGTPRQFDYTGGRGLGSGPFLHVLEDYLIFLSLAQLLSDFGVRVLKGAIMALSGSPEILQGMLQLQSVEARHAAELRHLRQVHGLADLEPWISGEASGIANEIALNVYAGEGNVLQGGFDLKALTGQSSAVLSAAFDEPLGPEAAETILSYFVLA